MALAIALVLLVVGSVLFHFLSPWWATPVASNWGGIDHTLAITMIITAFVFIAINLFIAYCVIRFRHRDGNRAAYEPENKKLEWWLTGFTSVSIIAMLAPGLFVYAEMVNVPREASILEVVAQQWQWSFRFPGKDGKLGVSDAQLVTADNPFGVNPSDPKGRDDILVVRPELHLPLNKPVKVLLRSKDVLHNFYVPQFRMKMDMVPGMVTYFWFTPTRTGEFEILCAEYCGLGHYNMRGRVVVEEEAQFQAWLSDHPAFTQSQIKSGEKTERDLPKEGKQLAQDRGCLACHTVDGSRAVGPSWKGLYGKSETMADGSTVVVDEAYLKESVVDPKAKIVQGYAAIMPPSSLSEQEMAALIAYIETVR